MNPISRSASPTLVLATRNRKKGEELARLLDPPWEPPGRAERLALVTLDAYPQAPEIIEDADTFAGNARKKAIETASALQCWVLADDSGLAVDALGGAPGVLSARYAGRHGDDEANNRKLLAALENVSDDQRGAAFLCALALADPSGTVRLEAAGACRGQIVRQPRGINGFGYDPLFLIREYHRTFGELSPLVKHYLSHRARACERLRPGLFRLLGAIGRARGGCPPPGFGHGEDRERMPPLPRPDKPQEEPDPAA
jgi:XTP/dITP diphosphohydrolase